MDQSNQHHSNNHQVNNHQTNNHQPNELRELPIGLIEPNLLQARRYFDEETLQKLASSLRERGVLQPVLVRSGPDGSYELIAGERRWRAAQLAGLKTIPGLVCPYDDSLALEAALIENMAREDLNPVEEARACAMLVKELGLTIEQVGRRVGRSRVAVSNLIRLLGLSEEILELMERGELTEGHGRALLGAKDLKIRRELADRTVAEGWSVRILEALARESNTFESAPNGTWPASHGSAPTPNGAAPTSNNPASSNGAAPTHNNPVSAANDLEQDTTAMNVARVWGDAVGEEVMVRAMSGRKLRVEFVFESPEGALAVGGRLAETLARGAKRR
jgi:ParB family transcriptional regulator, chromosome partitioning protein